MKQASNKERSSDVVAFIKGQHQEIKALFAQVLEARDGNRARLFTQLKTLMTAHEAAEEQVVHSEARKTIAGGPAEVAQREKEEAGAKAALAALSKLVVTSPKFESELRALQTAVLSHAASEETEELDPLAKKLDWEKLVAMRKQVEVVESSSGARGGAR